ncbi:hypothetical protein LZZ85_05435 [Terrimonas sp. NA20]|uniref:WG repeat-containing protein n=1 Tax=Terrimonas ginsenosidimutans TaxID=2908004 RepID=A0ABS9KN46_9BACT|nr:DUF6770 family protein [Terrimonas ginsenosidimutans]MCG2613710.1 hypothetical protein [Terrimonas ginsenosidimutans]
MRQILVALCLAITGITALNAQKLSIENVYKMTLRNSDAIREGSEVKGYYFFYVSDKIDRKTNEYTLQITDNNLKKLKDIKFQDSKDVTILESSFNGTDLIFLFYNSDARTFEYQVYGADGKRKFTYNRELSKKERRYLETTYLAMDDDDRTMKGLYPINGAGFISNMPSREEKDYTFQLDYFGTDKRKQWTYIPTVGAKKFIGDYLGTFNDVVYMEVLKFGSMMDSKPNSFLVGLDLKTGKQLFEVSTEEKEYKFYPASMSVMNDGKAYIYGEYFSPDGNIVKDKSLGFAFWGVDEKGKVLSEKYCGWGQSFGKYLSVSSKGKIEDFGFMYVHNMFQTADGSIFAIGEGYQKTASALGIISQVATAGRAGISTVKVKVTDMILIKFDKDFNVKDAKIYEKKPNKVELASGMEFVSTPLIGKLLKYTFGDFDYAYSQLSADAESFTVCYSDYVKGKDYKGGTFNSISYHNGKITTDKINTKSDASQTSVLPGKQGQVLVLDYYKKAKKMDAHFEKMN